MQIPVLQSKDDKLFSISLLLSKKCKCQKTLQHDCDVTFSITLVSCSLKFHNMDVTTQGPHKRR